MRYALLIYTDEKLAEGATEAEGAAMMEAYQKYTAMINERKAYLGGEALVPTSAATTVRVRDGKTTTTDGPFAETREQLGGFYLVEAKDLDEALDYAAQIPGAAFGSIEVRPIWEVNMP